MKKNDKINVLFWKIPIIFFSLGFKFAYMSMDSYYII